jgi:Tfp pilus assembly protein PilE
MKARNASRHGFTMIELLVVIGIIMILMALMAVAVFKMMSRPPQENTKNLILKLTGELEKTWKAAIDQIKTENVNAPEHIATWTAAQAAALNPADPQSVMDAYVRLRLDQEFPMRFADAKAAGANPIYAQMLSGQGVPAFSANGNDYQSSICMYMALTVARRGMNFDSGSLSPREMQKIGPLTALVDGWGEPLQFDNGISPTYSLYKDGKFHIVSAGPNMIMGDGDDVTSDTLQLGR